MVFLTKVRISDDAATGATLRSGTGGICGSGLNPKQNKVARSQTNQGSLSLTSTIISAFSTISVISDYSRVVSDVRIRIINL